MSNINCQSCQALNEETAHFCAECGQRLSKPNPNTQGDKQSLADKLRSPLMDMPGAIKPADSGFTSKTKGLRSPLLGGDEDFIQEEKKPLPKSNKLNSPLLGGAEPGSSSKTSKGGLRSPLFGDIDWEHSEYQPTDQVGHLHSPLLDQSNKSFSFKNSFKDNNLAPPSDRPSRLRSPILGGSDQFFSEPYYEEEVKDEPNVLRSPLLEAKLPLTDKPEEKPTAAQSVSLPEANKTADNIPQANLSAEIKPNTVPLQNLSNIQPEYMQKDIKVEQTPVIPEEKNTATTQAKLDLSGFASRSLKQKTNSDAETKVNKSTFEPAKLVNNHTSSALPGFLKVFIIPLVFAAIMKIMACAAYITAGQPFIPIVADQIGQLFAIICLIFICLASGNSQNK